jgi:hypothetical protein
MPKKRLRAQEFGFRNETAMFIKLRRWGWTVERILVLFASEEKTATVLGRMSKLKSEIEIARSVQPITLSELTRQAKIIARFDKAEVEA